MNIVIKVCSYVLCRLFGYQGNNLLFKFMPSKYTIQILNHYGASIANNVRIMSPLYINEGNIDIQRMYANLVIEYNVYIGSGCFIDLSDKVFIDKNACISHRVMIITHQNAGNSILSENIIKTEEAPVKIGSDAFIGASSYINMGVTIGKKSVIGAYSSVFKDIEDNVIAMGTPVHIISKH